MQAIIRCCIHKITSDGLITVYSSYCRPKYVVWYYKVILTLKKVVATGG
jgi:hypothetical protein